MSTPAGTLIPKSFDFVDFPTANLGTCWIYGKENDIHDISKCMTAVYGRLKTAFAPDLQHRMNTAM